MTGTPYFYFSYVPCYASMSSPGKVYDIWQTEFDGADAEGGCRCMVKHPQGIGRRLRMAMLERLI